MLRVGRLLSRGVPGVRLRSNFSMSAVESKQSANAENSSAALKFSNIIVAFCVFELVGVTSMAYKLEHDPQWGTFSQLKEQSPDAFDALTKYHRLLVRAGIFQGANLPKEGTPEKISIGVKESIAKAVPATESAKPVGNSLVQKAEKESKQSRDDTNTALAQASSKKEAASIKAKADAEAAIAAAEQAQSLEKKLAAEQKAKVEKAAAEKASAEAEAQAKLAAEKAAKDAAAVKALERAATAPLPEKQAVKPVVPTTASYSVLPAVPAEHTLDLKTAAIPVIDTVLSDLSRQTIELRKELEATLLGDLHELDENALRTRVTQLAAEFFERTKWEGVRVHQSIKQVENELQRKYHDLLKQQRAELELESNKVILAKEVQAAAKAYNEAQEQVSSHERYYKAALDKINAQHAEETGKALAAQAIALTEDMQDKLNVDVATLQHRHVKDQLALQAKLSALEAEVAAFQEATTMIGGVNQASANAHRFAAAVLNLQTALTNNAPIQHAAAAITKYGDVDPLVKAVVSSLPEALLHGGTPSVEELKVRFNVVREELRKVALAPEALPPVGPVSGDGTEEILSRAAHNLTANDLKSAMKELQGIKDPVSLALIADWKTKAENRVMADQAAALLHAHAIIKHTKFGGK